MKLLAFYLFGMAVGVAAGVVWGMEIIRKRRGKALFLISSIVQLWRNRFVEIEPKASWAIFQRGLYEMTQATMKQIGDIAEHWAERKKP